MSNDARELRIRLPVEAMRYLRHQAQTEGDSIAALGGRLLAATLMDMAGARQRATRDLMIARCKPESRDTILELFERGNTAMQISARLGLPYRFVMAQIGAAIDRLVIERIQPARKRARPDAQKHVEAVE